MTLFATRHIAVSMHLTLNSLPNDWSTLKAFVDNKMKVTEKIKFVLEMLENFVGKGENAGYQHFLFFPQYFFSLIPTIFSKGLILNVVKSRDCVVKS